MTQLCIEERIILSARILWRRIFYVFCVYVIQKKKMFGSYIQNYNYIHMGSPM